MEKDEFYTDETTGIIYPKRYLVFIFLLLFCFSCKSIPTPKEDIQEIEQTLIFEDKM